MGQQTITTLALGTLGPIIGHFHNENSQQKTKQSKNKDNNQQTLLEGQKNGKYL
jgi:hypothetical protein